MQETLRGNVRSLVPPWAAILSLTLVVGGRVLNSRLAFGMPFSWWQSAINGWMTAIPILFWFWPPRTADGRGEPSSATVKLALVMAASYLLLEPLVLSDSGLPITLDWMATFSVMAIYDFVLVFPFARLFARVRLDRTLPSTILLGPSVVFFFCSLTIPAAIQSARPGSPFYLRWLLLGVPVVTLVLLAVSLPYSSPATPTKWWRHLGTLLWSSARLPLLFCLGELGIIWIGAYGAS